MLPIGTDRQVYEVGSSEYGVLLSSNTLQEYEEVIIPPAKAIPPKAEERLMPVSELEELVKECFTVILESPQRWPRNLRKDQGYTSLNRIQSIVYPTAYGSNENLLICGTVYSAMLW
jgi:antiviral helicase SLH1